MFELLLLSSIALEPCEISTPGLPIRVSARCGTLSVPENRNDPDALITLRLAVLKATSRNPEPDPLFFLAGGPGQAATQAFAPVAGAFSRINEKRDIVLVDQRGTGGSNKLTCDFPDDTKLEEIAKVTRLCREQLPGDPNFYTTSIAVDDLDAVRKALGYQQINLLGVSYGTRVAQTYVRSYEAHVRSVVLDGVVPQTLMLGVEHAINLQRTLDTLLGPEGQAKLTALIERVEKNPEKVSFPHPRTGQPMSFTMNRTYLGLGLRFLAYAPETAALIPLLVEESNLERLASQSALILTQLNSAISKGMELSVICAEDVPYFDVDQHAGAGTLLADDVVEFATIQCDVWGSRPVPRDFHAPVTTRRPVLLLSGERDPVTPPSYGEQVLKHLENGHHLVAKGQGHNVVIRGCMPKVVARFLDDPRPHALPTKCLDRLSAAPPFVTLTGPEP